MQVAEEAEARHIRCGVDLILPRDLCRRFVQRRHGADGGFHLFRRGFAHTVGRADEPDAQRLGQDKPIAGAAGVVGGQAVRVHKTRHREAVFDAGVRDGVSAREDAPRFGHLFGTAAQDLAQDVQVHALREADQIQGRLHLAAHRIDIAEGVGCGDLPKGIGVIDHGRKKIHRLHQCKVIGDAVDRRVVLAVIADQQVWVPLAARKLFQNAAQHPRAEFGGAAAACTEHDLFFAHSARSPLAKCVRTLCT